MTASPPAAPDFIAENANNSPPEHDAEIAYCSAVPGVPGEELTRVVREWQMKAGFDGCGSKVAALVADILSLIRPALEAMDAEIERLQEAAEYWPETSASWKQRALSAEAKLAQMVGARENDAIGLDDWAYKWLIGLSPETDERITFKDGYFAGALHVLGQVRDRARMIADVDAVSIRREAAASAIRGEKT